MRAEALLENAPDRVLDLPAVKDADRLQAFNDTIHYVLPKLLLTITAFHEASFVDQGDHTPTATTSAPTLPLGIAQGAGKVEMVDPENANDRVRQLFEAIKARHGHPLVSSYYRGLGQWPDFLDRAWAQVAPYVGTADYVARRARLVETARSDVRSWPMVSIDVSSDDHAEIKAILSAFQLEFTPDTLLDVALIKSALEGRKAALGSRFSAV